MPNGFRRFIKPEKLFFVAHQNWAAGIAADDERLSDEINADDVKFGADFSVALRMQIVVSGASDCTIAHTFG